MNSRSLRAVSGLLCGALLLVVPSVGAAQEQGGEAEQEAAHFLRHEVSFILAGTYESRPEEEHDVARSASASGGANNFLTLGGEYEFRFHRLFGVGGAVEYITHEKNWLFVFPAHFHVYRGLKLLAGPGFERKHEHADTEVVLRCCGPPSSAGRGAS